MVDRPREGGDRPGSDCRRKDLDNGERAGVVGRDGGDDEVASSNAAVATAVDVVVPTGLSSLLDCERLTLREAALLPVCCWRKVESPRILLTRTPLTLPVVRGRDVNGDEADGGRREPRRAVGVSLPLVRVVSVLELESCRRGD